MDDIFEQIKIQLPPYLLPEQKEELYRELRSFPKPIHYYISQYENEVLQGDGWAGFTVIDFETGQKKHVKAILLSNTCDINPDNERTVPPKVIFAPLIKMSKYVAALQEIGIAENKIAAKVESIKRQEVTSIFHLPSGGRLDEDYLASLDDLHSMPFHVFNATTEKSKIFTLSPVGFYLFLLKLSIHFCRFNDGMNRYM